MKLLVLVLTTVALHAQSDPTGHWEGVFQLPAGEIPIQVDLANDSAGHLYGTFSSPAQQLTGFPLADLALKGRDIYFQIKGTPGNRAFAGALSADNKKMSGEFKQGPYSLHFLLDRTGAAQITPALKQAPISKQLEGIWEGNADVSGQQLQFVLTISNEPGGNVIHSLDDDLEIPIAAVQESASKVSLDLRATGGSYAGVLSADGRELSGTFTQGATVLPILFRRSAK